MSAYKSFSNFYDILISVGNFTQHLLLLAFRLYWGYAFHVAGCAKFDNVEGIAQFFAGLGIPFPQLMVYIVATVECVGGWCLIFGFASRLVSIPLAITMLAALVTAHGEAAALFLSDPSKFLGEAPVTYLMASLVVLAFGPGWISMDFLLESSFFRKRGA